MTSLRGLQTVRVQADYPWLQHEKDVANILERVQGLKQLIRASPALYSAEPQHDFVEYASGNMAMFGQVRLLIAQPYPDRISQNGQYMALIRKMKRAAFQPGC